LTTERRQHLLGADIHGRSQKIRKVIQRGNFGGDNCPESTRSEIDSVQATEAGVDATRELVLTHKGKDYSYQRKLGHGRRFK
jgi:hypothetical protein